MRKIKENKGITLIALIITIIVLLILAGVVINMTLGNDGIIGKAQSATNAYQNAQEKEEWELAKYEDMISGNRNTGNNTLFGIPASAGDGTQSNPYIITKPEQLAILSALVNIGNSFEGKYFKLENDIDLSNICGNNIEDNLGNIITIDWTPIGKNAQTPFSGIFNGNNKEIKNIYINTSNDYQGLFGVIYNGMITNLKVSGSIKGGNRLGGIAGYINKTNIINCQNNVTIEGGNNLGGIAGCAVNTEKILNASNSAKIKSESSHSTGGIVGTFVATENNTSTIESCSNSGEVFAYHHTGGITGSVNANKTGTISVEKCSNSGYIHTSSAGGNGEKAGGIIGAAYNGKTVIKNSYNTGTIEGTNRSYGGYAGIIAFISEVYSTYIIADVTIQYCHNVGTLVGNTNAYKGAIVGHNNGVLNSNSTSNYYYSDCNASYGIGGSSATTGSDNKTTKLTKDQYRTSSNFSEWDFTNTWQMHTDSTLNLTYPILK